MHSLTGPSILFTSNIGAPQGEVLGRMTSRLNNSSSFYPTLLLLLVPCDMEQLILKQCQEALIR